MMTLFKCTNTLVLLLTLHLTLLQSFEGKAQTAESEIESIMITFYEAPKNVIVEKASLRYNKKFALSFHTDDGIEDIYTVGFPFFTGINEDNTNYPGLFYTDGCGNQISFKLSNSVFSFSAYNNEDMHQPGNSYGTVTWPQLQTMVQNGCAVYNHGFTSDAFIDPEFMNYSIRRNESYIRRKLYETIPGGLRTRVFVNPNGVADYTQAAFNSDYHTAFRIGGSTISDNGVDVNAFTNWNQNLELNRLLAENTNVVALVEQMANADGNWWAPVFTHRIIEDYPQTIFFNDFNTIASSYGHAGQDNIWMASEEEILDYLRIRELTNLTYNITDNTLLILLDGEIPTDQRFYSLSLTIEVEGAVITNININGGTNVTYNGIGGYYSLINLEWDGYEIESPEILADKYVTIAENSQNEYDCLIAMDYVKMVPPGETQQTMKDRLCAIPNIEYEAGFCETCNFDLGPDREISQGDCVLLEAPVAEGNSYLWNNDSITSSIRVCPEVTTAYWVDLLTASGCQASDTVLIIVQPLVEVDFVFDTVCYGVATNHFSRIVSNDSILIKEWDLNGDGTFGDAFGDTVQYLYEQPGEQLTGLRVKTKSGRLVTKYHAIPVADYPFGKFDFSNTCEGSAVQFTDLSTVTVGFPTTWEWDLGDGSTADFQHPSYFYDAAGTYTVQLIVTSSFGCSDTVSRNVAVRPAPLIDLRLEDGTPVADEAEVKMQKGGSLTFIVESPYDSIIWGGGVTTETFRVINEGFFDVQIFYQGCTNSRSFSVVETDDPIDPTEGIMNLITPNGDGFNDNWLIDLSTYGPAKVVVYSRNGRQVFNSNDYQNDWDGRFNGNPLPEGTYYYMIEAADGKVIKGPISILR